MTGPKMTDIAVHEPPFDRGLVEEIGDLAEAIFGTVDRDGMRWRIERMADVSLVLARDGAALVGFKLGFAVELRRYHSWLGGVRADHRRQGIALGLMEAQHAWARERGYQDVDTGTVPDNVAMISLNLRQGFRIIGMYERPGAGPRVMMLKRLTES
jgi:GNAT superfamily N-acetyltransferase